MVMKSTNKHTHLNLVMWLWYIVKLLHTYNMIDYINDIDTHPWVDVYMNCIGTCHTCYTFSPLRIRSILDTEQQTEYFALRDTLRVLMIMACSCPWTSFLSLQSQISQSLGQNHLLHALHRHRFSVQSLEKCYSPQLMQEEGVLIIVG